MSSPRSEIISVDIDKLARRAIAQAGWVLLRETPDDDHIKLTVHPVADITDCDNIMFRNQRDAEKVFAEMLTLEAMPWTASRIESGGVFLQTSTSVVAVVGECLKWAWMVRPLSREEVRERLTSITQEIKRLLVQSQVTGAMKALNGEYKALRMKRAAGEKIPNFKTWMTARLEQSILAGLSVPA